MKYIVVDLEMNPVAKEYKEERRISSMEVIEIGAVVLDESFLVLGEFKTLVKPRYNSEIYKKYETLTGISTQMVSGAPDFATAYEMFVNWCESYGDEYEVYAWSENDYNQIVAEMDQKKYTNEAKKAALAQWKDFQKEYTEKLGLERIMSLQKALDYAGIAFEGRMHDALCDARNTAELFAIVRNEERCNVVLKSVMEALRPKKVEGTLGEMFDWGKLLAQGA
ncbi:MAG: exonuclease domain-containing protein [Lachnospiraceae bacterium]|nr:exonuclease domain-containing protein [Lachnospiraceae bacterium]